MNFAVKITRIEQSQKDNKAKFPLLYSLNFTFSEDGQVLSNGVAFTQCGEDNYESLIKDALKQISWSLTRYGNEFLQEAIDKTFKVREGQLLEELDQLKVEFGEYKRTYHALTGKSVKCNVCNGLGKLGPYSWRETVTECKNCSGFGMVKL